MVTAVKKEALSAQDVLDALRKAAKSGIAEAHAAGLATTHGDDKGVYKLYPDGHREYIKLYSESE